MDQQITLSPDLQKLLKLPDCSLLALPKPKKAELRLPSGAKLSAFSDISKGIPTDCSMSFSLVLQLAPMLASIECLVKVLALLDPLIKIMGALTNPPSLPGPDVIEKFGKAAVEVMKCVVSFSPQGGLLAFVKDIILLITRFLNCFIGQLETIIGMLSGLAIQMQAAEAAGNDELKRILQCAQDNGMNSADHLQGAIAPVMNLVSLVEPLLSIAGIPLEVPAIVPGADLDGMRETLQTLKDVVGTLEQIAEGIPV
jgi:hypothetical protein